MSYIDNKLKIAIANELGLQHLSTDWQERFGQKILPNYYWVAYLRYENLDEEIIEWITVVVKTNLWYRGLISSVNRFDSSLISPKRLELVDWDDPIILHLQNLDTVASLNQTLTFDGDDARCELQFETPNTICHFTVKQFPDEDGNLDSLWRKFMELKEFFLKFK